MMKIRSTPKTRLVTSSFTRLSSSGRMTMASVPQKAPQMVPRPPMMTPVMRMRDKVIVELSGLTEWTY